MSTPTGGYSQNMHLSEPPAGAEYYSDAIQNYRCLDFVLNGRNNYVYSGLAVSAGAGLTVGWTGGSAKVAGTDYPTIAADVGVATNNTANPNLHLANFVYVNNAGAVTITTTLPTVAYAALCIVFTAAGGIVWVVDCRDKSSVRDAHTVDGYHAAYLLARANHTGTQAIATLSDHDKANHDALGLDADTIDSYHASQLAILAAINTFTAKQVITASLASLSLFLVKNTHASGFSSADFADSSGTLKLAIGFANSSAPSYAGKAYIHIPAGLSIGSAGTEQIAFDTAGKMTAGVVPLARMGTVVASGTANLAAGTPADVYLDAGMGNTPQSFFTYHLRNQSGNAAELTRSGGVWPYGSIYNAHFGSGVYRNVLAIYNPTAGAVDIDYKVYKLTET